MNSGVSRFLSLPVALVLSLAVAGCGGATDEVRLPDRVASSPVPSPTPGASRSEPLQDRFEVPYVDDGNPAHTLDLYLPADTSAEPFPVAVFVHGGRWREGDKSSLRPDGDGEQAGFTRFLTENGFSVAAINYRLSGEAQFPANMNDVRAAVRYLRANAVQLGLDGERIAVAGDSSGGHLAMLAGTTNGDPALEGDLGVTSVNGDVQAVVSYYGLSDIRNRSDYKAESGCGEGRKEVSSEGRMLGAEPITPEGLALAEKASPLLRVTADSVPMLLFAGRQDCTAPVSQSQAMLDALKKVGVKAELVVLDAGHADATYYSTSEPQQRLLEFLTGVLG